MEYLNELKSSFKKSKPIPKNLLNDGVEIAVEEFINFVGGKSNFQKIVKNLERILMQRIKDEGNIVFKKFEYADHAMLSSLRKPFSLGISYTIWAVDSTEHMMTASHYISFKISNQNAEITSGWDG